MDVADEIGKEGLPSLINDPHKSTQWSRITYQIDSLDREKMHSGWVMVTWIVIGHICA